MSPISNPQVSAGVPCSIADTTTGLEPCIRNPNSPETLLTRTLLSASARKIINNNFNNIAKYNELHHNALQYASHECEYVVSMEKPALHKLTNSVLLYNVCSTINDTQPTFEVQSSK